MANDHFGVVKNLRVRNKTYSKKQTKAPIKAKKTGDLSDKNRVQHRV